MPKILLIDPTGDQSYKDLFSRYGTIYTNPEHIENVHMVVFTGGSDVSPAYYGHPKLPHTINNLQRDILESKVYTAAEILDIPMIGICRGAQFLCAMNGGVLCQHITNHTNCTHNIKTTDGRTLSVIGDHHQMMVPKGEYILEAWAEKLSLTYLFGPDDYNSAKQWPTKDGIEPEVVFWPKTHSLGVQFHPEWDFEHKTNSLKYFDELFNAYILN